MDPLQTLEDYLVSILIALARHSPQSADAILRCRRLIPTVIKMFTKQGSAEIQPSQIKATALLKVVLCANFWLYVFFYNNNDLWQGYYIMLIWT